MATLQILVAVTALVVTVAAQYGHGGGHAESFIHFVGPVARHAQPVVVTVKDKHGHGHEIVDYVAHPKYEFVYGVADHHTGDFHGQKESRDGHQVVGEYSLKEPSGNVRTVKYVADKDGFRAEVHNSHENTHPVPSHGSQGGYGGQGGYEGLGGQGGIGSFGGQGGYEGLGGYDG